MVTDTCQTDESLSIPVSRLISFRFVTIQPSTNNLQSFQWLSFEGASSYIVQLSGSEGIVFREKVKHQPCDNFRQIYSYREGLLEPRQDYIFTVEVEIDPKNSWVDYCQNNKKPQIPEYVAQGIKNIKNLDLAQFQVNILAQLDSLLIARDELLNIVLGVIRQGSNSETICFLNYFMSQTSAFELLAKATCFNNILNSFSEIAGQLVAANITLINYLQLSEIQSSLAKSLALKSVNLVFFAQNVQEALFLNTVNFNNTNSLSCNDCKNIARMIDENCPGLGKTIVCEWYNSCQNCHFCNQQNL